MDSEPSGFQRDHRFPVDGTTARESCSEAVSSKAQGKTGTMRPKSTARPKTVNQ